MLGGLLMLNAPRATTADPTMGAGGASLGGLLCRGGALGLIGLLGCLHGGGEGADALIPGCLNGLVPGGGFARACTSHCCWGCFLYRNKLMKSITSRTRDC
jgi:hypothetical protein